MTSVQEASLGLKEIQQLTLKTPMVYLGGYYKNQRIIEDYMNISQYHVLKQSIIYLKKQYDICRKNTIST